MGERAVLPHDRGHLLWTSEDGASRMLTSSMDRWTTAIVGDDGIDARDGIRRKGHSTCNLEG